MHALKGHNGISQADYDEFRAYLQEVCGIVLGDNKQYLVCSRLSHLLAETGLETVSALVREAQRMGLKDQIVDAMTTNETLWFRDTYPFTYLRDNMLPEWRDNSKTKVRIWSAACSSGQEPYSLSISVEECKRRYGLTPSVEIVATDVSSTMLNRARRGEYERMALGRGLSNDRLQTWFEPQQNDCWTVKPAIKSRVTFRTLNLLENYISLGKFDAIYCRNVLIYFSVELKTEILDKMYHSLKPGGYLFLGASEGLNHMADHYEMIHSNPGIIYKAK